MCAGIGFIFWLSLCAPRLKLFHRIEAIALCALVCAANFHLSLSLFAPHGTFFGECLVNAVVVVIGVFNAFTKYAYLCTDTAENCRLTFCEFFFFFARLRSPSRLNCL